MSAHPLIAEPHASDGAPAETPPEVVDVAVIIPASNEEGGVGGTVEQVRAALRVAEEYTADVLVVDDGSTDATPQRAEAAGARVLRLPVNAGYGAALKAGIAVTRSTYVVILDADGTYPPEAIPALLARAVEADMVVGARDPRSAHMPLARRAAKWFLLRLASYLSGYKIPDLNSGLRVMRRAALERFLPILPERFSFTTTITLALLCTQRRVLFVPIDYRARVGSSKVRAAHFTGFVMTVLRTVMLFNPLKVFLPLGTGLFLAGLAKFVYDVFQGNLSETAVLCFLAAILIGALGLLADMISRLLLYFPGGR